MDATTTTPERAGREGDQPLPEPGAESVFAEVHRRIDEHAADAHRRVDGREAIGIKRYTRSLETFNGRDAGRDLEEELLDGLAYATQLRLERQEIGRRLADALEQLRDVDALRLAAEGRADRAEAAAEEARQGWGVESALASDALARANLAEQRAEKAETDLASHVEAQDRRIADLKAQLAAARANWESERRDHEATAAAFAQAQAQLRERLAG
jgi:hypothetical protein